MLTNYSRTYTAVKCVTGVSIEYTVATTSVLTFPIVLSFMNGQLHIPFHTGEATYEVL